MNLQEQSQGEHLKIVPIEQTAGCLNSDEAKTRETVFQGQEKWNIIRTGEVQVEAGSNESPGMEEERVWQCRGDDGGDSC